MGVVVVVVAGGTLYFATPGVARGLLLALRSRITPTVLEGGPYVVLGVNRSRLRVRQMLFLWPKVCPLGTAVIFQPIPCGSPFGTQS